MRVLSIPEFGEWIAGSDISTYILASVNNRDLFPFPAEMTLRLHKVVLSRFTRRIMFVNDADSICFERVKEVHMYDDADTIGTVFDLVCEVPNDISGKPNAIRTIRFLAD